eukprot:7850842-Ditylum_brightwellii.AAC.1
MSDQGLNDKSQISAVMHTVISCLKEVGVLSAENNALIRHSCLDDNAGVDSLLADVMRRADLGRDISSGPNQTSHRNLGEKLNTLTQKVVVLDNSIAHLTDMLGAMRGHTGSENMVVELGDEIFKGEDDVHTWIETNLPNIGVFIDVYVIMELVLAGHINAQAQTMEQNMKLKLKSDEALVIKKLITCFLACLDWKQERGMLIACGRPPIAREDIIKPKALQHHAWKLLLAFLAHFKRISHRNCDHLTLASRSIWAIFKMNK